MVVGTGVGGIGRGEDSAGGRRSGTRHAVLLHARVAKRAGVLAEHGLDVNRGGGRVGGGENCLTLDECLAVRVFGRVAGHRARGNAASHVVRVRRRRQVDLAGQRRLERRVVARVHTTGGCGQGDRGHVYGRAVGVIGLHSHACRVSDGSCARAPHSCGVGLGGQREATVSSAGGHEGAPRRVEGRCGPHDGVGCGGRGSGSQRDGAGCNHSCTGERRGPPSERMTYLEEHGGISLRGWQCMGLHR